VGRTGAGRESAQAAPGRRHTPARQESLSNGARTPEELETLFEDALLVRDSAALSSLFADGALLAVGDRRAERGAAEIALQALATWEGEHSYVADPRYVMQARDVALVVSDHGVNVAQRSRDGTWRFAIVHLFRKVEDGKASGAS
jgi:ketosteroid isomerase-like protein